MKRGAVLDVRSERLLDDVALAAEIGLTMVRLDVPWSLAQPREQGYDGDVFEALVTAAQAARGAGVEPWFRLLQPAIPHWFDDEGGFTDARTAATFWPRWVELAADRLGDVAAGWVPFEAPFGMCNRLMPDDPRRHSELVQTTITAWRDAWRILHGRLPVATSLDVAVVRPEADTNEARAEARRLDHLRAVPAALCRASDAVAAFRHLRLVVDDPARAAGRCRLPGGARRLSPSC